MFSVKKKKVFFVRDVLLKMFYFLWLTIRLLKAKGARLVYRPTPRHNQHGTFLAGPIMALG